MATAVPAVSYVRMSSDKQEASPERQRGEIAAYAAKHGYRIVREYIDEGISGDATEKRTGFQAMIRDAKERGDFKAVVCWDISRFGRFDSVEAGFWIKPLRDAGVSLVTVAEGRVDWGETTGRLMYAIGAEGKHTFLRDLARNCSSGNIRAASKGSWLNGPPPYGFDKLVVNERGEPVQRVRRGEKYGKAPGCRVVLAPTETAVELETLRWIFDQYATRETSVRALAADLNARQVPPPGRDGWRTQTLFAMLRNPSYVGTLTYGRIPKGKYYRATPEGPKAVSAADPKYGGKAPPAVVVPDAWEAIVPVATWEAVQAKLAARKTTRSKPQPNGCLFGGLLFCGHCGTKMNGNASASKPNLYYTCRSTNEGGKDRCTGGSVREDRLLAVVRRKLDETFLNPAALAELRKELTARVTATGDPGKADRLAKRVAELDGEIRRGAERLLSMPDLADEIAAAVRKARDARDAAQTELDGLRRRKDDDKAAAAKIDRLMGRFEAMRQRLGGDARPELKAVIRQLVAGVTVWFDQIPGDGKYRRYESRGGILKAWTFTEADDAETEPAAGGGTPSGQRNSKEPDILSMATPRQRHSHPQHGGGIREIPFTGDELRAA